MLHHLDRDDKQKTTMEAYRVLRSSGQVFGVDFVELQNFSGRPFAYWRRASNESLIILMGFCQLCFAKRASRITLKLVIMYSEAFRCFKVLKVETRCDGVQQYLCCE